MKIQYITKRFRASSLEIIEIANGFVEQYAAQGMSLTLRQLYYRFIAADAFPNTQKSYDRLGSIINDARLAGLTDWSAIEDRGRQLMGNSHWDDASDIVAACVPSFATDKWADQSYRVEVWVEKQALEAVVGQAAKPLDCNYFSCKGYTSQSEMWRAAMRFKGYVREGQKPVIIHLGDHDPSGIDMTRDIVDRINTVFGVPVEVERIALNMDQVDQYDPPPNPAKLSDSRATAYIAEYGDSSWELDALEPAVLKDLIQTHILRYRNEELWAHQVADQEHARGILREAAERWDEVVELLTNEDEDD